MAYGLLMRILSHAKEQGWLTPHSIILDCFGGVGTTGILGAYEGYQVVCVELEVRFCKLAEQNFKLHDNAWQKFGNPRPVMIQGDSRRLCEVVEKADCILSSPPYSEIRIGQDSKQEQIGHNEAYSKSTPGQLGAMKPGKVDMVLSSPPYAETPISHIKEGSIGDRYAKTGEKGVPQQDIGYGQTPGNLGNLKSGDVDAIISSPPYENAVSSGKDGIDFAKAGRPDKMKSNGYNKHYPIGAGAQSDYAYNKKNENNLGNQQGDTFWAAALEIVQQCYQILKPGGHAVKDGENIIFCDCKR